MKKLFTLIAVAGMAAFVAGCGDESKPAKAPTVAPGTMHGPGAVSPGPAAHDAAKTDEKMDEDKADKDADLDKDDEKKDE